MTSASETFGEFSFTASSFTVLAGAPGAVQMQANFEGGCSGFGLMLGTMSLSRHGPRLGTWTCCTASFLESGDMLTGTAQGTVSSLAPNRWRTQGLLTFSDGRQFGVDGELDLERRSWRGHLLPRN
ncbi:MAG: hypothetical protein ACT4QA_12155 [Panacagrimonas sp.]